MILYSCIFELICTKLGNYLNQSGLKHINFMNIWIILLNQTLCYRSLVTVPFENNYDGHFIDKELYSNNHKGTSDMNTKFSPKRFCHLQSVSADE